MSPNPKPSGIPTLEISSNGAEGGEVRKGEERERGEGEGERLVWRETDMYEGEEQRKRWRERWRQKRV